jgi:restriction system protein
MELVALMPWWVGCALAVAAYWWLSHVAAQTLPSNAVSGQVGAVVTLRIWRAMAGVAQYLVPLLCFAGAGISAYRRFHRHSLITGVAKSGAADALDSMSWREFELLVGEALRLEGYRVSETGGGGADGGVDLVLRKGSEKFLVQCKQWKAQTVGVNVVRELYGVMAAKGATGGFVITSGRFTEDAKSFANGRNLNLVDGPTLFEWIKKAKSSGASSTLRPVTPAPAAPTQNTSPPCPVCAKPMVQRTAKRGGSAGAAFWGCSSCPTCRGTRAIY